MSDVTATIRNLEATDALRAPVLWKAIQALPIAIGSRVLDVGCGIGRQTLLLAEAIGPNGQVVGLDLAPALLHHASKQVQQSRIGPTIRLIGGSMERLPFADGSFDWAWSADCVGYPAADLTPALSELMRVLRPGGGLALLGWSSQLLLPGYPLLEARLNATCSSYAPLLSGQAPAQHFLRAAGQLRAAGLQNITITTLVGEAQAPLSAGERAGLAALLAMLWSAPGPETAPTDWEAYQRLSQPESPDYVLELPDYYACFTYTLICGTCHSRLAVRRGDT